MAGLCDDLSPPCHKCALCARMCASAARTKELLDPFNAEKQPGARIYHVSVQEKHTSGLIFFGWFPVGLKKQLLLPAKQLKQNWVWETAFSKRFLGFLTRWQVRFIPEIQAQVWTDYTYTRQTRLLPPFPVWPSSFICSRTPLTNFYCVKWACFHSCSFSFTCKSHSHLDTCVSPPGGMRWFTWSVRM